MTRRRRPPPFGVAGKALPCRAARSRTAKGKTGPKSKLAEHRERILAAVREDSAITLNDLREKLQLPVCVTTLWQALRTWGLVLKKSPEGR